MNELVAHHGIKPMTTFQVDQIRDFENLMLKQPQLPLETHHILHGGMYARTIHLEPNTVITGVLVEIATLLVINGSVRVHVGGESIDLDGYNILPASAHRKQAFRTFTQTALTMVFATDATTITEAEEDFTNEAAKLISRKADAVNHIIVTGE